MTDEDGFGPSNLTALVNVSRGTMDRLERYRALLKDWSIKVNLIGPKELGRFWRRHALDSAQLLPLAPDARRWLDAGAGAGFPGVVIACALAETEGAQVLLVESVAKKCAFLQAAVDALAIPAQVVNARVESLKPIPIDVFTARALAPLPTLLAYCRPYLEKGAIALFPRGERAADELTALPNDPRLRIDLIPSRSDSGGRIVRLEASRG